MLISIIICYLLTYLLCDVYVNVQHLSTHLCIVCLSVCLSVASVADIVLCCAKLQVDVLCQSSDIIRRLGKVLSILRYFDKKL